MSNAYGGLSAYRQFILYKKVWIEAKGKYNKIPCDVGGDAIDAHDTSFHVSCDEALFAVSTLGGDYGPAFVFTDNDPFFFLDIDAAYRQDQWSDLSNQLRAMFPTAYTEASLSNTGLHIVGTYTGDLEHKCKNIPLNIELYTDARFMALGTGYYGDVHTDCTPGLQRLIGDYFNPTATPDNGVVLEWTATHEPGCRPIPNDDALIQKALLSTSASQVFGGGRTASFSDLWNANADVLADYYPGDEGGYDASSADAALATHLVFWTGGDCERVSRLMRRSALVRDKWDRRGDDYLKRTVLGSKRTRGSSDYYRMTDGIIEVIEPCDKAIELGEVITRSLQSLINPHLGTIAEQQPFTPVVNNEVIDQIITRSFWSGAKSKLFILSPHNTITMHLEGDCIDTLEYYFDAITDKQVIQHQLDVIEMSLELPANKMYDLKKKVFGVTASVLMMYLKTHNQRERLDVRVDMFATRPRVEWYPEKVTVVFKWDAIKYNPNNTNPTVIADYERHFPELDEMLQFIVASRFASNRKHFYTWLQCPSDWGKGFFTGILAKLGVLVELSVKECEKAFEGDPLGRDASEFTRAFIVLFDEFKSIKSELKQLENTIPITPKNQLKQSVEVFTKLFTSAEGVESLAGENGVEDQFANRFSYIDGRSEINNRPIFNQLGGSVYAEAVESHIARRLNELVDMYVTMGERESKIVADNHGREFHGRRNIDKKFERISSNIPSMVADFKDWVIEHYQPRGGVTSHLLYEDGFYYLKASSKVVSEWIEETASRSERITLSKKKHDILMILSDDGRGVTNHKPNGKSNKYVRFAL